MARFEILDDQPKGRFEIVDSAPQDSGILDTIKQGATNLAAGAVRGAGSIGATLVAPYDIAKDALDGKGLSLDSNRQRRADIDAGLASLVGSDPNSIMYKAGKFGGEFAGTAGAGGLAANGIRAAAPALSQAPTVARALEALSTGGLRTGAPAGTRLATDLATRAVGGAANGALTAGLVNPEDAATGAAIGGAFPIAAKGAGIIGSKIGSTVTGSPLSPEVRALAAKAADLGIDIPADRLTNSKPLNALAAGLNYVPFSGRAATEEAMQKQMNTALTRTFGQNSDNVTQSLRKASDDLGARFDDVLKNNVVKVDDQLLSDLTEASQRAEKELGADGSRIIQNQINDLIDKASSGQIDGQAAYNIKRTLDRISNRNTPEAFYARDLKNNLMSALNRSLGPEQAAAFQQTRQQYGNMLSLENLAQNGADGDVSIARIANMKNINNPDLQSIADVAAQFLKPREGQHGAAQRALAGAAGFGLGGVKGLGVGIAAGRAANSALNSNVAKNYVLGQSPQIPNSLLINAYRGLPLLGDQ